MLMNTNHQMKMLDAARNKIYNAYTPPPPPPPPPQKKSTALGPRLSVLKFLDPLLG